MKRWERSDGRYYEAYLEKDLLGQTQLVRINGGAVKQKGSIRPLPVDDATAGEKALAVIERTRQRHGYTKVLDGPTWH